jgi:hypothetical protein
MKTLTGQEIPNICAIAIKAEPHPLKAAAIIYRAYEILEDGSHFPLCMGRETIEILKRDVKIFKSHKTVIFCEI